MVRAMKMPSTVNGLSLKSSKKHLSDVKQKTDFICPIKKILCLIFKNDIYKNNSINSRLYPLHL